MAWRRPGEKLFSEPMMVSLLTYICATRPQWVKRRVSIKLTEHSVSEVQDIHLDVNYDGFTEHSFLIDIPIKFDAYSLIAPFHESAWVKCELHPKGIFSSEDPGLDNDLNCSFVNDKRRRCFINVENWG